MNVLTTKYIDQKVSPSLYRLENKTEIGFLNEIVQNAGKLSGVSMAINSATVDLK